MKTKVLVTGSGGQLGKTLQHLISQCDDEVEFDFFNKAQLDITSKEALEKAFATKDYNFCINCAAYTNVENAETEIEKTFAINAEAVKLIATLCKEINCALIHISTDYVFDGAKTSPYAIGDETKPINQYGRSKLLGENYIRDILVEHYIIRSSWLYSIYGKNFLKTVVNKIKEDVELNIVTSQTGTPTSCTELSEFIYFIVKGKVPFGTYHFSAKGSATWYDFAKEIARHFTDYNLNKIRPTLHFVTKATRPKYSVLDVVATETIYKDLNSWQKDVEETILQLKKLN